MNILVGKVFGIGNAIMSIPMLKAIKSLGHRVSVLCGTTPDDYGAIFVFSSLVAEKIIDTLSFDKCSIEEFDIAIMAIPFDGRWQNGVHYKAKEVWDCRPRPDAMTTGLSSWKKHEVEYQMENAYRLGYSELEKIPDCSFYKAKPVINEKDTVYLGIGYKKDQAGFWKIKHWGNENYAQLVNLLVKYRNFDVVSTGDNLDLALSLYPIYKMSNMNIKLPQIADSRLTLEQSLDVLNKSDVYVGNDTGMMHLAASLGMPVVGIFMMENAIVKNHPWCNENKCLFKPTVDEVYKACSDLLC